MSAIGRLLGRSPFHSLQIHMDSVTKCVLGMENVLDSAMSGGGVDISEMALEVSDLEHQTDIIKDDIRQKLVRHLFMSVNRQRVLDILSIQDRIADAAEDVCIVLTFKNLKLVPQLAEDFAIFRDKNLQAFKTVKLIVEELNDLVESGFGGAEAEKVNNLVRQVAKFEHEADVVQRDLIKKLFAAEDSISYGDFYLWTRLVRQLGQLANLSENLANTIRSTLDL